MSTFVYELVFTQNLPALHVHILRVHYYLHFQLCALHGQKMFTPYKYMHATLVAPVPKQMYRYTCESYTSASISISILQHVHKGTLSPMSKT
jgi:hypothetical protein